MNKVLLASVLFLLLLRSCHIPALFAQSTAVRQGATVPAPKFEVVEATIAETEEAIRSGRVTCRQLVEAYLSRIRTYDQSTRLNAIVLVNPAALEDADKLDAEFARSHKLRPLHGIGVIVKDNYDTRGLATTGGALAMK